MSEPETEVLDTARAEAVERTWRAEHPRVVDVTVAHVEGNVYRVDTPGAAFKAEILDGGLRVTFTAADPAALDVALGQPLLRRLLGPPEAIPVAPLLGLDPVAEIHRALGLVEALRVGVEGARHALRGDTGDLASEVERLRGVAPVGAVDVTGSPISPEAALRRLVLDASETRGTVTRLGATLAEARSVLAEVRPRVRTALVDASLAKAPERVRDLPSLSMLGEMHLAKVSEHVRKLDACEEALDRLDRATAEAGPLLDLFRVASERFAVAALTVVREVGVRTRAAWLDTVRPLAVKLRLATPTEFLAEGMTGDLDTSSVPRLVYPADLLGAPRLE